ncbi:undecaprenyl-phosphate glucose phosphotransferase [Dyella amyloliquefaciens]|uniref:undecaprenyl-phosphate glucose phosphotransferase n=1 Tax=Dyella amyloliquefaciens TaxID=1770545 RepID=UPI00102E3D3F|nr:undecaprenyl-phosphate glucose phosphotransferase [Dyella amyloliquefaciens]
MLSIPGVPQLKRAESHFFSKYAALLDITLRVSDVLFIALAAVVVYRSEFGTAVMDTHYISGLIRTVLLALVIFPAAGLYRSWRGENRLAEIGRLWVAWTGVMVVLLAIAWALKTTDTYSRVAAGAWFIATGALLTFDRLFLRWVLGRVRAAGTDSRRVLLVGGTQAGHRIAAAARSSAWLGLDVVGYISTPFDQVEIAGVTELGDLSTLAANISACAPDQIWIALPMRAEETIQKILHMTLDTPVTVRLVPDFFGYELINHHAAAVAGVPVITLRSSRVEGHAGVWKAIEDRSIALLMLLLLGPLMLLIALCVKLSSAGPVFFKQRRHGLGGREFEVLKFRSMRMHAEAKGEVTQARRDDARVTPLGRFLRSSSLDELPQLINVLRGDMSIVGPRPHAVEHNRQFSEKLQGYMQRHGVKPGMTGLAQIRGFRGETDTTEKMAMRVQCDIQYIKHWSIWVDLKIIFCTPFILLRRTNAY